VATYPPKAPTEGPDPLHHGVAYCPTLLSNKDAAIEWTGETIRLALEPSGKVIFDVPPGEVTKVRISNRFAMTFTVAGRKHRVVFPGQAMAAVQGPRATGAVRGTPVQNLRAASAEWPATKWLAALRELGVPVADHSRFVTKRLI
jgi:hypothetical protein